MFQRVLAGLLGLGLLVGCNWSPKRWGMAEPKRCQPAAPCGPYFPKAPEPGNPMPEPVANTWQSEHREQVQRCTPFRQVVWDYRVVNFCAGETRPIRKIHNALDTMYVETEDYWLYAVDKANGVTRWALHLDGPLDFPPAVTRGIPEDRSRAERAIVVLSKEIGQMKGTFQADPAELAKRESALADAKGALKTLRSLDYMYLVVRGGVMSVERNYGLVNWKVWPPGGPSGTPYATTSHVFVPTHDRNLVRAYDIANGHWSAQFPSRGTVTTQPYFDGDRLIFTSEDGGVYGYNMSEFPVFAPFFSERPVRAEMTPGPDGIMYVASSDFAVYALDRTSARLRWKFETGASIEEQPMLVGNTLYVWSGGNLFALDTANRGALKWVLEGANARPFLETRTRLYATDCEGNILGVNLTSGQVEKTWSLPLFRFFFGDSDTGTFYAATSDGYLYAAQEMLE